MNLILRQLDKSFISSINLYLQSCRLRKAIIKVKQQQQMESYSQPESMTALLTSKLENPFNKFCVDCTKNESTQANISFGTFIC